jgi:hypothetical protein
LRVFLNLGVGLNVNFDQVVGFADFFGLIGGETWTEVMDMPSG